MRKMLVLVATNFEDIELIAPLDIFKREGIEFTLASVEDLEQVTGKYNAIVKTTPLKKVNVADHDTLFLPGGPGYQLMMDNEEVIKLIKKFDASNFKIFAICAAPAVLDKAGVIGGKQITAFPGYLNNLVANRTEVVVSENLVTGRDFLASINFANTIVKILKGITQE